MIVAVGISVSPLKFVVISIIHCSNQVVLYGSTWSLALSKLLLVIKWLKSSFPSGKKKT